MERTSIYLSIDLESWASPNLPEFTMLTSQEKKRLDNGHIKKSALRALTILEKYKVKLTFFIVGQLYEWYPEVVEIIASKGHEIGYHTHSHDDATDVDVLLKSINRSKKFLKRFNPVGFRAPRLTINHACLTLLKKYGFTYDSSTYGKYVPGKKIAGMCELPVSSFAGIPVGSGYFIGMLGKQIPWFYQTLIGNDMPVISFIHNWQILKPENPIFPTGRYLLSHPHYLPYMADCSESFEHLIQRYTVLPMKNLLQ